IDDAVTQHDPVLGDTGQRHAGLRPPPPEATSVREDHATAIVMDGSEHPSVHARSAAAGDHVAADQTVQKMILLHYCSPFPGCSGDCLLILARIPPSHWGATPRQPDHGAAVSRFSKRDVVVVALLVSTDGRLLLVELDRADAVSHFGSEGAELALTHRPSASRPDARVDPLHTRADLALVLLVLDDDLGLL